MTAEYKRLDLAVRVYPSLEREEKREPPKARLKRPRAWLVLDMETRIDETQSLTFGSYRFLVDQQCFREGLIVGDDLPSKDRAVLEQYVATHGADTPGRRKRIGLLTRSEFAEQFFEDVYKGRCLVIGFNLPFDLSRIARAWAVARGRYSGGFSFDLCAYEDETGQSRSDKYRPRVRIKHLDSKRALKGFTSRKSPDRDDLIPEGSRDGQPQDGYVFQGHFLDLRTLAYALTDQSYSLESACKAFGVEHGKQSGAAHGEVTEAYIDYNRRDVLATAELAAKLLTAYDRHPIRLQVTKAFSPASIGKAYLRAMGIQPILEREPDFPKDVLGYAASAFFGGRTSSHIRRTPVPVVYTDFLSMYPTVNSLMGLWRFVTADHIEVRREFRQDAIDLLDTVSTNTLFDPSLWPKLTAFVKVIPDGDILPARCKYSQASNDWQIGVNHLRLDATEPEAGLWFSLPDVVASVILTGKVPLVVDAFALEPHGVLTGLKSTTLNGQVHVDPVKEDFFKTVIEQRRKVKSRSDLKGDEKARLDRSLKVLANATSYGIYAEMNREESDQPTSVTCYGIDAKPFQCRVAHPDIVGEYCFPPMASLITGAARLMLALLERSVSDLGGTYAMEDTDSMAIVATQQGGFVECPGGPEAANGQAGIHALSWAEVAKIAKRFELLNPYDPSSVKGSILKIEDDNYDPATGAQRQIYCYSISAKRYALFILDDHKRPHLLRAAANNPTDRWSQHGLGHLINPSEPDSQDRKWIAHVWLNFIRAAHGIRVASLPFASLPAVGRVSITSPPVMKAFLGFNQGKPYEQQIKPFNFLLSCQVLPFGHPPGVDPERFHLITPYNSDSRRWIKARWIDRYSGTSHSITTDGHHGTQKTVRVKTYGDILREYEYHPEAKCNDATGDVCGKRSTGLLARRHILVGRIRSIGKESNVLEDVEAGVIHSANDAYTEYPDPNRSEWKTSILPRLKRAKLVDLVEATSLSRRALMDLRAGRSFPHPRNEKRIVDALTDVENNADDEMTTSRR